MNQESRRGEREWRNNTRHVTLVFLHVFFRKKRYWRFSEGSAASALPASSSGDLLRCPAELGDLGPFAVPAHAVDSSQAEEEGNTGLALAECSCSGLDEGEEKDTEVKVGERKEIAKTSLVKRYAPYYMS